MLQIHQGLVSDNACVSMNQELVKPNPNLFTKQESLISMGLAAGTSKVKSL
jgi:hypothetical protein